MRALICDLISSRAQEQNNSNANPAPKTTKKPANNQVQPTESVLFLPYTPNSSLKKTIQEIEGKLVGRRPTGRVRIVERTGPTIFQLIGNKSPWTNDSCGRPNCTPCKHQEGSCRAQNLVYRITCQECLKTGRKSVYIGESHRFWWDRSGEHLAALKARNETNALAKHWIHNHPEMDTPPSFKFEVLEKCRSSLQRQIMEAIHIQNTDCDLLLNSRGEWGINIIPQLKPTEDGQLADQNLRGEPKRKTPPNPAEGKPQLHSEFDAQYTQRRKVRRLEKASQGLQVTEPGQQQTGSAHFKSQPWNTALKRPREVTH